LDYLSGATPVLYKPNSGAKRSVFGLYKTKGIEGRSPHNFGTFVSKST
jgi:hypothetical protein